MGWFDYDPSNQDYMSMLGVDPSQLRTQQISALLTSLGSGLLSGRNWGEGLSRGVSGAAQNVQAVRQNALSEGVDKFRVRKYFDEAADAKRMREGAGKLKPPTGFDPAVWEYLPADKKFDIWETAMQPLDAPKTVGGMMWDAQAQDYVPIPGYTEQASAIAAAGRQGPAPQRLPLTTTVWDQAANNGKGAMVYASGPLEGRLAGDPNRTTPTPSAASEKAGRLTEAGFSEKDVPLLTSATDPQAIEAYRPMVPPLLEDGGIDPDALDTETRYLIGDVVYRWDGQQFYPW